MDVQRVRVVLARELWSTKEGEMNTGIGVAVFVKTPSYSGVKTRLGATIGKQLAEKVYLRLVEHMERLMKEVSSDGIRCYWAVAEQEAMEDPIWGGFSRFLQSGNSLGSRIQSIVDQLLSHHDGYLILGADCPYLSVSLLREAAAAIDGGNIVIGPASDGGFWGLGEQGNRIPYDGFLYSQPDTLAQIQTFLSETRQLSGSNGERSLLAEVQLTTLEDVDDITGLKNFYQAIQSGAVSGVSNEFKALLKQVMATELK